MTGLVIIALGLLAFAGGKSSGIGKLEFSPNRKLNGVLSEIRDDILYSFGGDEDPLIAKEEVLRYKREFPHQLDYNIVEYGNLLVYDIRDFYRRHGYKSMEKNE